MAELSEDDAKGQAKRASTENTTDDPKLKVLLQEHAAVTEELSMRIRLNHTIVGLGFTVLAAALTLGIKENIPEILLGAPILFFMVFFIGLFNTNGILTLAGYKRYIEERINHNVGVDLLKREQIYMKLIEHHFVTKILYVSYVLVYALILVMSLRQWSRYGTSAFIGAVFMSVLLSATSAISVYSLRNASSNALSVARTEGRSGSSATSVKGS